MKQLLLGGRNKTWFWKAGTYWLPCDDKEVSRFDAIVTPFSGAISISSPDKVVLNVMHFTHSHLNVSEIEAIQLPLGSFSIQWHHPYKMGHFHMPMTIPYDLCQRSFWCCEYHLTSGHGPTMWFLWDPSHCVLDLLPHWAAARSSPCCWYWGEFTNASIHCQSTPKRHPMQNEPSGTQTGFRQFKHWWEEKHWGVNNYVSNHFGHVFAKHWCVVSGHQQT